MVIIDRSDTSGLGKWKKLIETQTEEEVRLVQCMVLIGIELLTPSPNLLMRGIQIISFFLFDSFISYVLLSLSL